MKESRLPVVSSADFKRVKTSRHFWMDVKEVADLRRVIIGGNAGSIVKMSWLAFPLAAFGEGVGDLGAVGLYSVFDFPLS